MSQTTFYRKYRSQTFADVVGQTHVVQTLENGLRFTRLSHAYIFSGPRGTGKTSMARILAKTVNCKQLKDTTPCLTCSNCTGIKQGNAVDIVEIDAASNTGVDNIRSLNEQVHFTPVECDTKFYIIDEAHMLSTGAFNALLKTLEEPPSKTIFILATTEPHKIPATIHSRCQHLHFKSLTRDEIMGHLRAIAQKETITIPDSSLSALARQSSGCMRDAISLLNQLYSFKGNTITDEDVHLILGATEFDSLSTLLSQLLNHDQSAILNTLRQLFDEGVNPAQLLQDLSVTTQHLLYISLGLTDTLDLDEGRQEALKTLAKHTDTTRIHLLLDRFSHMAADLRAFPNAELLLQVTLLKPLLPETPVTTPTSTQQTAPTPSKPVHAAPTPAPKPAPPTQKSTPITIAQPSATAHNSTPQAQTASTPQPNSGSDTNTSSGSDTKKWAAFLDLVKRENGSLYAILNRSTFKQTSNTSISIYLSQNFKFFREKLQETPTKTILESHLKTIFGTTLTFTLSDTSSSENPQSNAPTTQTGSNNQPPTQQSTSFATPSPPSEPKKVNEIVALFEGSVLPH